MTDKWKCDECRMWFARTKTDEQLEEEAKLWPEGEKILVCGSCRTILMHKNRKFCIEAHQFTSRTLDNGMLEVKFVMGGLPTDESFQGNDARKRIVRWWLHSAHAVMSQCGLDFPVEELLEGLQTGMDKEYEHMCEHISEKLNS